MNLQSKTSPQRCSYCHDRIYIEEWLWHCDNCSTTVHDECYRELKRCPTCNVSPQQKTDRLLNRDYPIWPDSLVMIGRHNLLESP